MPAASGAAGFTLLEILVALVVLGILLAGLSQATRFGLLATDHQTRLVGQHDDLDAVDGLLRHLIEQVDPGNRHDAPVFQGNSGSVEFTSELPLSINLTNHEAEMRLLVDAAHRLVLRWAPAQHVIRVGAPPAPTDTVLLEGVDHLELAYWPRPETGGSGWRTAWNAPLPPALVRIRIVFSHDNKQAWPDIVGSTLRERE